MLKQDLWKRDHTSRALEMCHWIYNIEREKMLQFDETRKWNFLFCSYQMTAEICNMYHINANVSLRDHSYLNDRRLKVVSHDYDPPVIFIEGLHQNVYFWPSHNFVKPFIRHFCSNLEDNHVFIFCDAYLLAFATKYCDCSGCKL